MGPVQNWSKHIEFAKVDCIKDYTFADTTISSIKLRTLATCTQGSWLEISFCNSILRIVTVTIIQQLLTLKS